jgi:hypothetical protein
MLLAAGMMEAQFSREVLSWLPVITSNGVPKQELTLYMKVDFVIQYQRQYAAYN